MTLSLLLSRLSSDDMSGLDPYDALVDAVDELEIELVIHLSTLVEGPSQVATIVTDFMALHVRPNIYDVTLH